MFERSAGAACALRGCASFIDQGREQMNLLLLLVMKFLFFSVCGEKLRIAVSMIVVFGGSNGFHREIV